MNPVAALNSDPTPASVAAPGHAHEHTPGFSDGLGDRVLTFDQTSATSLELLKFRRDLSDSAAFQSALRERVEQLKQFHHLALAVVRKVDWVDGEGLTLVSKHTAGRRLSELFPKARGPVFALEFLRHITPVLAALQDAGPGIVHGALAPERIVVGRDGQLVVVEHVLGSAINSLEFPASRLRSELGLAVPSGKDFVVLNQRTDVMQLGFVALSLLLGRRLDPADFPANIVALLDESAQSESGESWGSSRLRSWLERALQIGIRPFATAQEAHDALGELPSEGQLHTARSARPTIATMASTPSLAAAASAEEPAIGKGLTSSVPEPETVAETAARIDSPVAAAPRPTLAALFPVSDAVTDPSVATVVAPKGRAGRGDRTTYWVTSGLSVLAVAEAVVIAVLLYTRPKDLVMEVRAPSPLVAVSTPTALATPAPLTDTPARAVDPANAIALKAPIAGSNLAAPSEAVDATAADRSARTAERFGGIRVSSPIELQVFEGGKLIGSTAGPIAMIEGSHAFDLVNESLGYRTRQTASVRAGQMTSLPVAVPSGRVSINAVPWADVLIDGNAAGQTPLANLSVPIGQHEIVFRHPQFGEQHQTAVVKSEGLTRVSANLQR